MKKFGSVILAAGEGRRLKLNGTPKPLAPICGKRLVDFPIQVIEKFYQSQEEIGETTVVVGYKREEVESYLNSRYGKCDDLSYVHQKEQKGTADALMSYFSENKDAANFSYTIVMCADTPLIREYELTTLYNHLIDNNLDGVAASFTLENPYGYGRIIKKRDRNNESSSGFHIVEERDLDSKTEDINEVNSGLYILKTSFILSHLSNIKSNNKNGEFYLTDLFQDDFKVDTVLFEDGIKFLGVNNLEQLEIVGRSLYKEKNSILRDELGVRFIDSSSVYIDWDVNVGGGTVIYPNVIIEGESNVGNNVIVGLGSYLKSSEIEEGVEIKAYSHLENCIVRKNAVVGPYARLRPAADIGENSKIGNFVEIKKSKLKSGVKVSHLSYIGDAEIGENTNIGCGFITCNYDGVNKHKTVIGKNSFIGSDTQVCAPLTIGDECFVGSGSTLTKSIPDNSFAVARGRQITKEGKAHRFIKKNK